MSRFDVIFDYGNSTVYLRKNKTFSKPFYTNLSALEIEQSGLEWVQSYGRLGDHGDWQEGQKVETGEAIKFHVRLEPIYQITQISTGSAASRTGLTVGDQLLKVNGRLVKNLSLSKIRSILQSAPNKKVEISVKRSDKVMSFVIELKDDLAIEELQ